MADSPGSGVPSCAIHSKARGRRLCTCETRITLDVPAVKLLADVNEDESLGTLLISTLSQDLSARRKLHSYHLDPGVFIIG